MRSLFFSNATWAVLENTRTTPQSCQVKIEDDADLVLPPLSLILGSADSWRILARALLAADQGPHFRPLCSTVLLGCRPPEPTSPLGCKAKPQGGEVRRGSDLRCDFQESTSAIAFESTHEHAVTLSVHSRTAKYRCVCVCAPLRHLPNVLDTAVSEHHV